jgi:hypothetical protein
MAEKSKKIQRVLLLSIKYLQCVNDQVSLLAVVLLQVRRRQDVSGRAILVGSQSVVAPSTIARENEDEASLQTNFKEGSERRLLSGHTQSSSFASCCGSASPAERQKDVIRIRQCPSFLFILFI